MKELSRAVSTGMPAKDSLELVKKVGVAKIKSSGKGLFQLLAELRWHSREIARYTCIFSSFFRGSYCGYSPSPEIELKHSQAYETVANNRAES